MGCRLPGSSVHGIFQARILEWFAVSFSRGSARPRNRTWVSHTAGILFTIWATREAWTLILNQTIKRVLSPTHPFMDLESWGWRWPHSIIAHPVPSLPCPLEMSTLIQRPSVLGTGSVHCGPLWNLPKPRKATGEPAGSREAQFWPQHWFHSCCLPTFLKKNWAVLNPNSKSNYCQPPAHAKKQGTKLMGYTASGKNLSGKGELWSSVRKCGKGVRNTAEARPSQDWAAEGSKWVRPKPPRGHAYQITRLRQRTEPQKENPRCPPGRIQEVPGKEKRHPGGWGVEGGFKPHPVEWQWPGISHGTHRNTWAREREFIRPLLLPGRPTQKGNMWGDTDHSNIWKSSSKF